MGTIYVMRASPVKENGFAYLSFVSMNKGKCVALVLCNCMVIIKYFNFSLTSDVLLFGTKES